MPIAVLVPKCSLFPGYFTPEQNKRGEQEDIYIVVDLEERVRK